MVKAAGKVDGKEFERLRHLQEAEPERIRRGIVLYTGPERIRRGIVLYTGPEPVPFGNSLFPVPMSV